MKIDQPALFSAVLALGLASTAAGARASESTPSPSARPLITQQVRADERAFLEDAPVWIPADSADARSMAPPDMRVSGLIMLLRSTPERRSAEQRFLRAKQTLHSREFGQALTLEQIAERFGASPHDIEAITDWLRSEGLSVDMVAKDRRSILFSGSARDIGHAFMVQMYMVEDANGKEQPAAATRASVPAALAPAISGVVGIYGAPAPGRITASVRANPRVVRQQTKGGGTSP